MNEKEKKKQITAKEVIEIGEKLLKYKTPFKLIVKRRFVVVFLVKREGTYEILSKRSFKPTEKVIRYMKGNSHIVDIERPTFSHGLMNFYYVDINSGQLFFVKQEGTISKPFIVDQVCKEGIMKDSFEAISKPQKALGWMNLVLALGLGLGAGLFIGVYFL